MSILASQITQHKGSDIIVACFNVLVCNLHITGAHNTTQLNKGNIIVFSPFGATAPIGALAYLHETFRFTSVFEILDSR
jgi:hypothetical protein